MQFSEAMQTEGDYMFDTFVAGIAISAYFFQKDKAKVDLIPYGVILSLIHI